MNEENIVNSIVLYIRKLLPSGPKPTEVKRQNWSLLKRLQIAQAENKPWRAELKCPSPKILFFLSETIPY